MSCILVVKSILVVCSLVVKSILQKFSFFKVVWHSFQGGLSERMG